MAVAARHTDFAQYENASFLDARYTYRFGLYQAKPYPQASASNILSAIKAQASKGRWSKLYLGETGIYIGVYPECNGLKWIWPVLDIDGAGKDPLSAIQRGQTLYTLLRDMGIAHYFQWGLSGTGLRAIPSFLIPFELRCGVIRWFRSLADYGVDPGPFEAVDPPPVRLLCYRGHQNQTQQSNALLDRHSILIDVEILFSIESLSDYDDLVRGKPNPQKYAEWLEAIFPVGAYDGSAGTPEPIVALLDLLREQSILAELQRNIFSDYEFAAPGFSAATFKLDLEKLLQHLDSLGIGYKPHETFYTLSQCPKCGKPGKAWITRNGGRLKCFSASCPAYDGAGGMRVSTWAGAGFFKAIAQEPPPFEFVDLTTAENVIIDHLTKPSPNKALACSPGVGKTRTAIKFAEADAAQGFIVYALPNHHMISSTMDRLPGRVPAFHFLGRGAKTPDGNPMCSKYDGVRVVVERGYYPSQTVCLECEFHPRRVARRIYKSSPCGYYKQFQSIKDAGHGLILCTSSTLPYLLAGEIPIGRAYIDEQAVGAMIHASAGVSLGELQNLKPFFPEIVSGILDSIQNAAEKTQRLTIEMGRKVARLYSTQPACGQFQGKIDLWKVAGVPKDEAARLLYPYVIYLLDSNPLDLYENGINLNALKWLAKAIGDGVAWLSVDVKNAKEHLRFEQITRHTLPARMGLTVLDATASRSELSALFQHNFDIAAVNVSWTGRRIFLRQGMGKVKTKSMPEDKMTAYLRAMVEPLPEGVRRALLITHCHCEEMAKAILGKLRPGVQWSSLHYWAARGLNDFESSEAVLCFGVPVASPGASADIAAALFPDNAEEQAEWLRAQNENELYQAVHRARFVRYPGRTLIVMGHFWPAHLLGEPDMVIDRRRNQTSERPKEILERALTAVDALGFITLEVTAWMGVGAKRDEAKIRETRKSALAIFREIEAESQNAGWWSLISNISIKLHQPEQPLIRLYQPESENLFLSNDDHFWRNLLYEIEKAQPGIGRLSVRLPNWGHRNWTRALGSIEAAQRWEEIFGAALRSLGYDYPPFNAAAWREGWGR